MELPSPHDPPSDTPTRFLAYLDYYREFVADRVGALTEEQRRTTVLPSGWTPLELAQHLAFMERRWLQWGFAGRPVTEPWGDADSAGRWRVGPGESTASVLGLLASAAEETRTIVAGAELADRAAVGGRFTEEPAPTLEWILFHVLQEYARHVGHLDVVVELATGRTGE